jgi:molybdopterin molybdotransferase
MPFEFPDQRKHFAISFSTNVALLSVRLARLARLKGFEKLTDIDNALSILFRKLELKRPKRVQIPVKKGLGRVTAGDVMAAHNLPRFDRSAVDGYAVKAQNTFEASQFNSRFLRLTEDKRVRKNEARRIWTGNPLPLGTNAVVMLEHTKKIQDGIEVWTAVTPGENVSKKGEDVQKGEIAIRDGTQLGPHHLALLAALELVQVGVREKPKVAVLSTGNELIDLGCKPKLGQVLDVNRLLISCMCTELGAETVDLGIATDNADEISIKILEALTKAQVVITTGGTSVGKADLVPGVVNSLGKPGVLVHGIAMRPGMPTGLAILRGKPIIMLSGNPVAAMIGFEIFGRPLLTKLSGLEDDPRPMLKAKLTNRVASALGRRVFLRVRVVEKDNEFFAEPVRIKGSGILSTLTKANGYVAIPEDREGLEKGESMTVYLFDRIGAT